MKLNFICVHFIVLTCPELPNSTVVQYVLVAPWILGEDGRGQLDLHTSVKVARTVSNLHVLIALYYLQIYNTANELHSMSIKRDKNLFRWES